MKLIKVCLRNYVIILKNLVEKEIRVKKMKVICVYIELEWLKIDFEFEKLYRYFSLFRIC